MWGDPGDCEGNPGGLLTPGMAALTPPGWGLAPRVAQPLRRREPTGQPAPGAGSLRLPVNAQKRAGSQKAAPNSLRLSGLSVLSKRPLVLAFPPASLVCARHPPARLGRNAASCPRPRDRAGFEGTRFISLFLPLWDSRGRDTPRRWRGKAKPRRAELGRLRRPRQPPGRSGQPPAPRTHRGELAPPSCPRPLLAVLPPASETAKRELC